MSKLLEKILLLSGLLFTPQAYSQAVLPSTRLNIATDTQAVEADASAWVIDWYTYTEVSSFPGMTNHSSATLANTTQGASAGTGDILCTAMAMSTAMCIIPPGSTNFVPQVDCTMNLSANADDPYYSGYGYADAKGNAVAQGTFTVVANPSVPGRTAGTLSANLYLVATGADDGYGSLGSTNLSAFAAGIAVNAFGDTSGFFVTGPGFMDFVPGNGGLNNFYNGTRPAAVGNTFRVTSTIDSEVYAMTEGHSNWGFSASASYAIF